MTGFERAIESTSAGEILVTGHGHPRCFRVVDNQGHSVTGSDPVDIATAFRLLNSLVETPVGSDAA